MGSKTDYLTGLKFNRWTIISYVGVGSNYQKIVKAKCDCGTIKDVYLSTIKHGKSTSCGCYCIERLNSRKTHGMSKHPIYRIWSGMKERCSNPNFKQYADYGGRGITVYENWKNDFSLFFYWVIKNGYQKGLELDRIDNDKGYCPSNCRFTTHTINNRNKRDSRYIEYNGEKRLLIELCELYGFNYKTIDNRIKRGCPPEEAFAYPVHSKRKAQ